MWRKFLKIAYNLEANANKTRGGSLGKPVNLANFANVVKMEILSKSGQLGSCNVMQMRRQYGALGNTGDFCLMLLHLKLIFYRLIYT